jgi:uracil-DNA glycosylase
MNLDELFFGTTGYINQGKIAIVGESWGDREAYAKQPFVGESGQELTRMLADAGIDRSQCFITNVCSRHPPSNDMKMFFSTTKGARSNGETPLRGLYPDDQTRADLARLHKQLAYIRPKVIIAFGNYALWALTQSNFSIGNDKGWKIPTGITSWRGSYLWWNTWDVDGESDPNLQVPVIPTYHPAAILRQWSWRTPAVHDIRVRALPLSKGFRVPDPEYRFTVKPTFEQAIAAFDLLDALPDGHLITCDTETRSELIACIGIAWSDKDAICIPFLSVETEGSYWTPDQEVTIRLRLASILSGKRLRLSNQNINYDRMYWYYELFIHPEVYFDTMLAHHLCWPGTPKNLGYLSSLYRRYHRYWKDDGRNWTIEDDEKILWNYNCEDCVSTWEITKILEPLMKTLNLYHLWPERLETLEMCFEMMIDGVAISNKERSAQVSMVMQKQQEVGEFLEAVIPDEYKELIRGKTSKSTWYSSPAQTASLFYDILGAKEIINRKTKQRTTDDDALQKIMLQEPLFTDIVERLQYIRSLGVIYSTFLSAEAEPDGRMRTTWDPTGTSTFRFASYENAFWRGLNMMNIPKEKDD